EDHQHARFEDVWIDGQRFVESVLGLFVILRAAEALEDAVYVTSANAVVRQRKIRIEFDRAFEVLDRGVAILARERAKDEARKQVAAAQVLLVSRWILRRGFGNARLLRRAQLNAQPLDDSLCDRVLKQDNV